jgi:hypothetical protein
MWGIKTKRGRLLPTATERYDDVTLAGLPKGYRIVRVLVSEEAMTPRPPSEVRPLSDDLQSFFTTMGACPDCGSRNMRCVEDGGHDSLVICECGSKFGVNWAPFSMIERV